MNLLNFLSNPMGLFKPLVFGTVGAKSPRFLRISAPLLLATLLVLVWMAGAHAAEDFLAPADEGLISARTQLVAIAASIFGLAIVGVGIGAALLQRIQWERVWNLLWAALFVTVGPTAVSALFDMFGK